MMSVLEMEIRGEHERSVIKDMKRAFRFDCFVSFRPRDGQGWTTEEDRRQEEIDLVTIFVNLSVCTVAVCLPSPSPSDAQVATTLTTCLPCLPCRGGPLDSPEDC